MKKRALISVFDKNGILEFARSLERMDWEIISTGGTYKYLKDNGVNPIEIEEITKFPEILNGRVKTLNPYIHGGILYKRDDENHCETIISHGISGIDMVVNNLYPFEEKLREGANHEDMVENIDIGGPSMIRAAAKNYRDVLIVTDPEDYIKVSDELEAGEVREKTRLDLSRKAFGYTAHYDSLISNYFNKIMDKDFPEYLTLPYKLEEKLRYGENPHQKASYYKDSFEDLNISIRQLHGKELSYNNLNDIYGTVRALKEFEEPSVVAVKHTNPCGIGSGRSIFEAYMKAYECDTESIFGGIVALNRDVDAEIAGHMATYFLEVVIAPGFTEGAMEILTRKKNIRLIEIPELNEFNLNKMSYKQVLQGMIYQETDKMSGEEKDFDFQLMTSREPSEFEIEDLKFAWRCVKNVASNGVVLVKNKGTIGIGQGEVRRSWAVEGAIERSGENVEDSVLASDAFFFEDTVEALNKAGVKAIISPGGSVKDEEVIKLCEEYDISLIFTGVRHFRH